MALSPADIAYQTAHADDNAIPGIIIANVVCTVAATICVGLRFLSRRLIRAAIKWDDWLILLSLLSTIVYISMYCLTTRYNLGRHTILVTDFKTLAQVTIAAQVLYTPPITLVKISILVLYRRIFPSNGLKMALYATGAFVLAYNIAALFSVIFQCYPIEKNWNPLLNGHCIDYGLFVLINGVFNIVSDVIILGLPLPSLWGLQVSTNRKFLLSGMFLLGGLVCIVSIVRLFFLRKVNSTSDPAWDNVAGATLSTVEVCTAIISACLPTYRPLYKLVYHGSATGATTKAKSAGYHDLKYGGTERSAGGIEMRRDFNVWQSTKSANESVNDDRVELYPQYEANARGGRGGTPGSFA